MQFHALEIPQLERFLERQKAGLSLKSDIDLDLNWAATNSLRITFRKPLDVSREEPNGPESIPGMLGLAAASGL